MTTAQQAALVLSLREVLAIGMNLDGVAVRTLGRITSIDIQPTVTRVDIAHDGCMLTVDATLLGAVRLNVGGLFQFSGSINVDSPHRETGTFLPSRVPVGSTTSVSTSLTSATASTASSHDPMEVAPNPELDHRDHPARPAIRMFPPVSDDSVVHVTVRSWWGFFAWSFGVDVLNASAFSPYSSSIVLDRIPPSCFELKLGAAWTVWTCVYTVRLSRFGAKPSRIQQRRRLHSFKQKCSNEEMVIWSPKRKKYQ
ncbi:hypothetical protein CAOG_000833 [Capsaspora owczarzaki ATCC 30864]|uniref:Uncharacterized protein n=1 Tax=Capsaspora owczarzaki (strain ATCC 30864) TaxID=595528 RepID=A0A0D2X0M9_CAPO3|nr:hypothetical protein CAOG_000833 [Capsaspora owczarzaki ATCC 30864]